MKHLKLFAYSAFAIIILVYVTHDPIYNFACKLHGQSVIKTGSEMVNEIENDKNGQINRIQYYNYFKEYYKPGIVVRRDNPYFEEYSISHSRITDKLKTLANQ